MKKKIKCNVFLLFVVVFLIATSSSRNVNAEENSSVYKVRCVTFEYMDDPYTGESYSYPVGSLQASNGEWFIDGMISRENYNFYWCDVETKKILTATDVFEKGKEYSLSLELPCEFDQVSWDDNKTYRHYVYEDDFEGWVGTVKFTNQNFTIEGKKIIVKDIYSKICIDRPEDKIRIHSIDFRNISTNLYEGQNTDTLNAWRGYEETPIYINGYRKVEKGDILDKNLKWGLWWVKLDYDAIADKFTLASPSDSSSDWWKLDFKEVEPDTYYGLVMILRWQYKYNYEIAVDTEGFDGSNFKFIPLINGEGMAQNCESTFYGGLCGDWVDPESPDPSGYELMAGVFSITKSLPADADIQPEETNDPAATVTPGTTSTPSPKPSVSVSPAPIQTTVPYKVTVPSVEMVKSVKMTAGKKKLLLKWKKSSGASGYQIQISTKKNFKGAKKISISKSKNTYTMKGLKAKKKYYIRIRAYKTL